MSTTAATTSLRGSETQDTHLLYVNLVLIHSIDRQVLLTREVDKTNRTAQLLLSRFFASDPYGPTFKFENSDVGWGRVG